MGERAASAPFEVNQETHTPFLAPIPTPTRVACLRACRPWCGSCSAWQRPEALRPTAAAPRTMRGRAGCLTTWRSVPLDVVCCCAVPGAAVCAEVHPCRAANTQATPWAAIAAAPCDVSTWGRCCPSSSGSIAVPYLPCSWLAAAGRGPWPCVDTRRPAATYLLHHHLNGSQTSVLACRCA